MKRLLFVANVCFALGVTAASAVAKTWTGQISDSMCGKDHSMMEHGGKKVNARDCTLECVKAGGKYVFVSQGTVYEIDNQSMKDLQDHAGHNVQLSGEMASDGKTIHVSKITMPAGKQ